MKKGVPMGACTHGAVGQTSNPHSKHIYLRNKKRK